MYGDDTGLIKKNIEPTIETTQNTVITAYVRFKVTTCLYLTPNNRARSLSTLIAVDVNIDTPHNVWPVTTSTTNV